MVFTFVMILIRLSNWFYIFLLVVELGASPMLFEQPIHQDDWDDPGHVSNIAEEKYDIPIVADESCCNIIDVKSIIFGKLVDVMNIKIAIMELLVPFEVLLSYFAMIS